MRWARLFGWYTVAMAGVEAHRAGLHRLGARLSIRGWRGVADNYDWRGAKMETWHWPPDRKGP